jgi:hypothetical protein
MSPQSASKHLGKEKEIHIQTGGVISHEPSDAGLGLTPKAVTVFDVIV